MSMNPNMFNGLKRSLGRLAGASVSKMGDIIIFTSVAGWLASSAAQIYGIAVNKNYSHDQKKYMINQEVFDALTNISLYLSITKSLTLLSSQMVKTAKLAPKSIVEFMRRNGIIENRGKFNFDVTQARNFDKEGMKNTYNAFKCFSDASAATIGGIISSNIITPIVRNHIAAYRQNKYKSRNNMSLQTPDYQVTTEHYQPNVKPQTTVYPRTTFDDFRTRVMSI